MRTIYARHWTYYAPADDKGGDAGGGGGDAGAAAASADQGGKGTDGAASPDTKGGSAADGGAGAKGAPADKGGDWAPDWRQKLAGDDPKALKQLERFASPKEVWHKARALETKLSSGELRSNLPKDATPEQTAAWRAENGIPEAPDKYDLKLKDGLVIGKEDQPLIDGFLKTLHGQHATSAQASEAINWYYETQEKMSADRAAKDAAVAQKASDELHAEWGAEYRLNMNKVMGLLDTMPKDVKDLFVHGRLADSTPLFASPNVLRALNNWARTINPVSTLIPNSGGDISGAIDAEIKQIEKNMAAPKGSREAKAYWDDPKAQERYRELLDGRARTSGKKAA